MVPIHIGEIEIGPGAALAPMAGITNPPFRKLCTEMGACLTVTELVSCHALIYLASKKSRRRKKLGLTTLALLERYPGESPFAVQIFGREPALMAEAARIVESEGADIVDLNFGCPARKVVKNGEGAGVALMRDPARLQEIAAQVVAAVKVPVTAKMRLGWSPLEKNAVEIARRLEDVGVALLCIHGRTRDQGHSGPVDLDGMAAVVDAVRLPVIGNGGIRDREGARLMRERTGCARIAVGQGARGNPWIFAELSGKNATPSLAERIATCIRHLELYVSFAGEKRAVVEMRKHAAWYLKGFAGAAAFRARLGEAVDEVSFRRLLAEVPTDSDGP